MRGDEAEDRLPVLNAVGQLVSGQGAGDRIGVLPEHARCRLRGRRVGRGGETGAVVAARPVDRAGSEVSGRGSQLSGERGELLAAAPRVSPGSTGVHT